MGQRTCTALDVKRMVADYARGLSCLTIGVKYGFDKATVHRWLKNSGVTMRSRARRPAVSYDTLDQDDVGEGVTLSLASEGYAPRIPKPAVQRTCMTCPREFSSDGAHHRICDSCKKLDRWRETETSHRRAGVRGL